MSSPSRALQPDTPVQFLKGVGPIRAQQLRRLGIERVVDLLHHYPVDYAHRGQAVELADVRPGQKVLTRGRILDVQSRRTRRGGSMVVAVLGEGRARLGLTWFNAPYVARQLRIGRELVVTGEVSEFRGRLQIVNPSLEESESGEGTDAIEGAADRPLPRYPLTAGLRQQVLRRLVALALDALEPSLEEPLPAPLRSRFGLVERGEALRRIHRPSRLDDIEAGRERLAFEEAFALQIAVRARRKRLLRREASVRLIEHDGRSTAYVDGLGFELTAAQRRVLATIVRDLRAPVAMHRLVQGDVGSGKTVVAMIAMLFALEAGGQAAFMAPTEVLARQHARRQIPRLDAIGVRGEVLTGSTKASERRRILAGLRDGTVEIVFGTHALIQDDVCFRRLGLAVVDEQHRFGVLQRAALARDGAHVLVMSATPIPRSLALTVYGDLDLSVLDERPPGRKPVETEVLPTRAAPSVYEDVRAAAERGERVFLVYPLVEESEELGLQSAETAFEELRDGPLRGIAIGLLHGRMGAEEKERVAKEFGEGHLRVLVATTVIEVGVDVAEASLMVIHHAERFGLAQLHQLRGRVGRGEVVSRCVLLASDDAGPDALARLKRLAATDDGFRVAELDLEERGMGELHGIRQHGDIPFRLLHPLRDVTIVENARAAADDLLEADPSLARPEHAPLARWLDEMGRRSPVWSVAG